MNNLQLLINNDELLDKYPEVHRYLNKYYPIGLKKDDQYYQYPGIKKLDNEIQNLIINKNNYEKEWNNKF